MARNKSAQNVLMWMLMVMLVAGLAGFGIDGFLSQRVTSIGSVGGREIPAQAYSRALQSELRAFEQQTRQTVPFAQAQAMGLDAQVRGQLVMQAALENEAERIGISIGDVNVQRTVAAIRSFQGPGGTFDLDTYRFQLQNVGQTPAQFEQDVRRDAARGILQAATAAGIETPANLRGALVEFYAQRHSFDLFTLEESALSAPVEAPSEAEIEAYYTENIATFTAPETRHLTYAWITPEMVLATIDVDEGAIEALYQQRISDYVQPERRLVERLVFADEAAAQAALARITAGTVTFDDLVAERGLTLDDVDMGDVSEAQLGAAGAAVFALADTGEVVGPFVTNLGPALFRMNAILNAQEVPLSEVHDELRAELAGDRARRAIAEQQEAFDDLLAGGATLEQLADETAMELGTLDWSTEINEGIAAYTEFRAAAAAVSVDDFPELAALSDGGLFALRLDSVTPATPHPLDTVREAATAGARAAKVSAALLALGQTLSVELAATGAAAFGEAHGLAPQRFEAITRLDRVSEVPATMFETILASAANTPVLAVAEGRALLALVGETLPADAEDAQTMRLIQAIDEQVGSALAQDVFDYFARALQAEAGITFNQAAIDAVHASFP